MREESIHAVPQPYTSDEPIYAVPGMSMREASIYDVPSALRRSTPSADADASSASMRSDGARTTQYPDEHIYDVPHATRANAGPPAPRVSQDSGYATPLVSRTSSSESGTPDREYGTPSSGYGTPHAEGGSAIGLPADFKIPEGMVQVYPAQEHGAALRLLMVQSADEKAAESPYAAPTFRRRLSTALSASFRRARARARSALRGVAAFPDRAFARGSLAASSPRLTAVRPTSNLAGKSVTKDANEANAGNGDKSEAPEASFTDRLRGFVSRSFETIATFLRYAFQK